MPACLVECGFITSETERAKLFDPEYQQKVAKGIFNGIQKFLPLE
jgi:N-acetylmuramoyl-L-alanine amidase